MDISKGYLRLFRQMLEWEWYDNPNTKAIFIHCLLKANDKAKDWRDLKIKRGQFVTSLEKLATSNGLTIRQTRTALKNLQMTQEIDMQTTSRYSIITVKNYNLYQASDKVKRQANDNQTSCKTTTTNNNIDIYNNNNIISLNKRKISKNEREILKNYLLNKKRKNPIDDVDAYIGLLVKNGDVEYQLERALKWYEKQKQKKQEVKSAAAEKIEIKEDVKITDAAFEEFKKAAGKIRKGD